MNYIFIIYFFRFPNLREIYLNDNEIKTLGPRSFVEMTQLTALTLEANHLTQLPDETFQNLHRLQSLNLARNRIGNLNFNAFDSIGTLAHLCVDLSHNDLKALKVNRTTSSSASSTTFLFGGTQSNIMSLDLSFNNISGKNEKSTEGQHSRTFANSSD